MPAPNRPRVLVVDDDADMLAILEILLGDEFDVRVCDEALGAIFAAFDSSPEAIVLDLQMPGFGGWDVVRALREDARTKHAKIVILTATEPKSAAKRAAEFGCAFVAKPLLHDELLNVLRDQLNGA